MQWLSNIKFTILLEITNMYMMILQINAILLRTIKGKSWLTCSDSKSMIWSVWNKTYNYHVLFKPSLYSFFLLYRNRNSIKNLFWGVYYDFIYNSLVIQIISIPTLFETMQCCNHKSWVKTRTYIYLMCLCKAKIKVYPKYLCLCASMFKVSSNPLMVGLMLIFTLTINWK